jgi:hypothetical protein
LYEALCKVGFLNGITFYPGRKIRASFWLECKSPGGVSPGQLIISMVALTINVSDPDQNNLQLQIYILLGPFYYSPLKFTENEKKIPKNENYQSLLCGD